MKHYKHMDLEALRLVLFLADGGGLSYASFKLGIPLSSASYKLRRFEASLGTTLFTKEGRNLALRRNTQHFVQLARDLLTFNDSFFQPSKVDFRICISDAFIGVLDFDEILSLIGINPKKINVKLVIRTDAMLLDLISQDSFDIALFWDIRGEGEVHWLLSKPLRWVGKNTGLSSSRRIFARPPCIYREAAEQALATGTPASMDIDICAESVQQALSLVSELGGLTIATDLHLHGKFADLQCLDAGRPSLPVANIHLFQREPNSGLRQRFLDRLSARPA